MAKKTGLGQGVGALFGDAVEDDRFFYCDINRIVPNKHQPRVCFDEELLEELAQSIKENGIIQPLIVSKTAGNAYELVAGERRLRASKSIGLKTVPVVVQNIESDDTLLELALIENIQRTDLNSLEEAEAYKKLIDRFGYTQEETARRVGKKRSTIANTLRLLLLPDFIKRDILSGLLSEGHARALLRIVDDRVKLQKARDQIVKNKLSVRQSEKFIRKLRGSSSPAKATTTQVGNEKELPKSYKKALENQLTNRFNSKVTIHSNGNRGKIEIEYYSIDDLERLVSLVLKE